jgi:pimeloyl-ACP methyl ester carboxylesterase
MKSIYRGFFLLIALSSLMNNLLYAQTINREDLVYEHEGNVLRARIIYPETESPIPFLVFVGGDEAFESYNKDYFNFLQQNFEDVFLTEGIGLFYINTRGIDGSDGRWQRATFEERAEDVIEGLALLRSRKEVDTNRIAVFGHGTGAYIAQIVAADEEENIAALLNLAAPAFDYRSSMMNAFHGGYVCAGIDSARAMDKARRQTNSSLGWVNAFPIIKKWRQSKVNKDFENREYLSRLLIPTLFVYAENDDEVYGDWSADSLNALFRNDLPDYFSIIRIPEANHSFRVAGHCFDGDINTIPFSDRFRSEIRDWVIQTLK